MVEKLLLLWINGKQLAESSITETIICEKTRALYGNLLKLNPGTSTEETSPNAFMSSRGWFDNFKKNTGVRIVVRCGEATSSDTKAVEDFPRVFRQLIATDWCVAQHFFNCDETGLFWKKNSQKTKHNCRNKKMLGRKL